MKSQTPRRSTRTGRRTPWTPIFDSRKRKGDILVGDTPGIPADYDLAVINDVGAMWFSTLSPVSTMIWPSRTTVLTGNYADESVWGRYWFEAWYLESTFEPADHEDAINTSSYNLLWYTQAGSTAAIGAGAIPQWPSQALVYSNDYADESEWGRLWFEAWFIESGLATTPYNSTIGDTELGVMWYSALAALSTTDAAPDAPWENSTTSYASGGRTYYEYDDPTGGYFWSADPNGVSLDVFLVGGGGSGGVAFSATDYPGGGGGADFTLSTSQAIDGGFIEVADTTPVGAGSPSRGANGDSTILTTVDGTTYTAVGGSGGGTPTLSSGAGRTGQGSGGGGGANTTPVSGAGGAGVEGNNGGAGGGSVTSADNRGGGGGGAGGAGTTGVAGGTVGDGGTGTEYPSGSGDWYCGGGGGRTGAGSSVGGSGVGGGTASPAGTANTGSGGAGQQANPGTNPGGSGRAIISHTT